MSDHTVLPVVDREICTGCGECVQRCPAGAVALHGGQVEFVATERCTYCGVCEDVCPEGAVGLVFQVAFAPRKSVFDHSRTS
jgi:Pyruvate/2-oxoacid:ferredoxin oxidoreductase delta subunit